MSITVEKLCFQFKDLEFKDLERLVGNKYFKNETEIKPQNIVIFGDNKITSWAAKEDKMEFVNALPDSQKQDVMQLADIKPEANNMSDNNKSGMFNNNMDTSIFAMQSGGIQKKSSGIGFGISNNSKNTSIFDVSKKKSLF